MKIICQIGLLFGLFWVSECIEAVLPIPFPASVISLLVLLVLFLLRVLKIEHIQETADLILGNLGFFFVPVSVSIMNYVGLVMENALAFFTICVVSTVVTYAAASGAVRLTRRLLDRHERRDRA